MKPTYHTPTSAIKTNVMAASEHIINTKLQNCLMLQLQLNFYAYINCIVGNEPGSPRLQLGLPGRKVNALSCYGFMVKIFAKLLFAALTMAIGCCGGFSRSFTSKNRTAKVATRFSSALLLEAKL